MTKEEYLKDIEVFLRANRYTVVEHSPITLSDNLMFDISNGLVLKITNDVDEIKAAEKYLRKHSVKLSNITKIKNWGSFHIIIFEKLQPLTESQISSFKLLEKEVKRFRLLYNFIDKITFGKKKILMGDSTWIFSTTSLEWLKEMYFIHNQAIQFGIENPDGYFDLNNLGLKRGEISSYIIKDIEESNFFANFF